mmetsp:Transcript_120218/g.340668  ORF Transcript_120218/g.340668 Transcript_120218/m.340668 type:complete len:414 (-) Transcript_120218:225-1466(-)
MAAALWQALAVALFAARAAAFVPGGVAHLPRVWVRRPLVPPAGAASSQTAVAGSHAPAAHISRTDALDELGKLQALFQRRLEAISSGGPEAPAFRPVTWERDAGQHGGGTRLETTGGDAVFNRATINLSGVHYEDVEDAKVVSASALSVILHPRNPYAPSMHFHISYIETRAGQPFWRMIADLNPSIENRSDTARFEEALQSAVPGALYSDAKAFGDKYFHIPQLGRARGASHMFIAKLEPGTEMPPAGCAELARRVAERAIGVYCDVVQGALQTHPEDSVTPEAWEAQLAYHTLYLFQVLILDHGTTTGLLAHNDNDVGTLGSIPNRVDRVLLESWMAKVTPPQDILLRRIIDAIPGVDGGHVSEISEGTRQAFADAVRQYYREDMSRVKLQGDMDMAWWASRTEKRLAEAR